MLAGTGALLVLIVVLITGGFTVALGPVRFSSHSPGAPLAVAAAAWLAAALHGGRAFSAALELVGARLDRHAPAIVLVAAAAAAGVGLSLGTHTAGGADSSGYVSQGALFASGRLVRDEPLARAVSWPDATWVFSPLGYRPGARPGESVPTYAPGLPLVMAGAQLVGGEPAVYVVVPLLGALAVWCTYLLGARLHSRTAGAVAALLLATSPIVLFQIVQPMSDVPVTAWFVLALVLALGDTSTAVVAAGLVTGLALLTRPNLLPVAAVVALVACTWPWIHHWRRAWSWRRLAAFAAGCAPAPLAIAFLYARWYGSPLASGYGSPGELYSLADVWPNVVGYASRVVRGDLPALAIALASAGALLVPAARVAAQARRSLIRPLVLAILVAGATLACYLPYFTFVEWSYLRFLLPAYPAALVLAGALLVEAAGARLGRAAGLAVLCAAAVAAAVNVNVAGREQAFNLQRYESRYRSAGRYLEAALPPNGVVIALQESGSARYYTGRPVVRWDMLRDLDAAVADLTALGHAPVLLVETSEGEDLRRRFPESALARLDWPPRADIGSDTRARVFAPVDRGAAPERVVTDRFE